MKKWIRIILQTLLYIISHGSLVLSELLPNTTVGQIIVLLVFCISTYYLWNKTTINTMISSIITIIIIEFLILYGHDGTDVYQKSEQYFKSLVTWLVPLGIVLTILSLVVKHLFTKKEETVSEEIKKK